MRVWYTAAALHSMGTAYRSLPLLLASSSPWRRALCAQVGLPVEARAPLCDEARFLADSPEELALVRARAKAESLAQPDVFVIGADQVCHLAGRVFGKPADRAEHVAQLLALRGRTHRLSDGVVIIGPGGREEFVVHANVTLRADLSDQEIIQYVESGDADGCAGGYRAEGPGAWLVDHIDGDSFTVVGLPLYDVLRALRRLGWQAPPPRHMSASLPHGTPA
jgi:septum formation protein